MELLFSSVAVCSVMIALDVLTRIFSLLVFLGWTYFLLPDIGHYNNHYYLQSLFAFLLVFVDADNWGSIRSLFLIQNTSGIPFWKLFTFQLQIFIE